MLQARSSPAIVFWNPVLACAQGMSKGQDIALCCLSCNTGAQEEGQPLLHQAVSIILLGLEGQRFSLRLMREFIGEHCLGHPLFHKQVKLYHEASTFSRRTDNKLFFLLTLRKILVFPACQLSSLPSTASQMWIQLWRTSFFS